MNSYNQTERQWYRLDNAAKLYPAVRNSRWSANFRVSVTLREEIDPKRLQQAVNATMYRLTNFRLKLHRGLFWYYLEEDPYPNLVQPDVNNPCRPFSGRERRGQLFRVRYYHKRIAVEFFHVLTDGTGAMIFLKNLTAEYLRRKEGIEIPFEEGIVDLNGKADPEEMEDSFPKYAKFRTLKSRKENKAYHFNGTLLPLGGIHIVTGTIPLDQALAKAKGFGVSLTEFLVSVMIFSIAECQKNSRSRVELPVKVSVPVNLRKYYPSKTLRNFALYVNPGIEPRYGEFTLEEITEEVHHFMRMNLKEKYLNAVMCKNLSSELNPVLRMVPLFVKNAAMSLAFRKYGDRLISSTLSNLGAVKVPKVMEDYIEHFDFMLGRFLTSIPNATAVSYRNALRFTWTSGMEEKDMERGFFTTLIRMGLPVRLESNLR